MMKRDKAGCNQVFQDQIWRDYIGREWWSTIEWPKKYGFLSEESKLLQRNILHCRKTGEMNSEASSASSSPGDTEEIAEAPKTQHPLPTSTAHMIGWTLSKQENPEYKNGYSSNVKYRNFLDPPTKHGRKKLEETLGIPAEAMN
ncbi:uncharacterized protein LOC134811316 [Bolinopsis microptera]|uniref:uncharacterized protein LOC134811316 n=1 Tax=Bolinopsis microptera TaxID=2820187 RepID=UPI003079D3FD